MSSIYEGDNKISIAVLIIGVLLLLTGCDTKGGSINAKDINQGTNENGNIVSAPSCH